MADVILDTDVLVDHLQGIREIGVEFAGSAYSSITRAELYSAGGADERVIDRLLDQFDEIPVHQRLAEEAGRIRRGGSLRLRDALIAATAVVLDRSLYTRNVRDFRKVRSLTLYRATRRTSAGESGGTSASSGPSTFQRS
jgi:predicted nucleic acid-binding protein